MPISDTWCTFLRDIPHILSALHSVVFPRIEASVCYYWLTLIFGLCKERESVVAAIVSVITIVLLPLLLPVDVLLLISLIMGDFIKFVGPLFQRSEQQTAALDLHSIAWALRTSLDGPVRLSALNYLATITLPDADPTLVIGCSDVFVGCVKTTNGSAVITQGSEQLAAVSALCCLHTFSQLLFSHPVLSDPTFFHNFAAVDPTPRDLEGIRHRYVRALQSETNFDSLPFSHVLDVIHSVLSNSRGAHGIPNQHSQNNPLHVVCRADPVG